MAAALAANFDESDLVSPTKETSMPSNYLPQDVDSDKLAEAALAILALTLHGEGRVWKSLDWSLMDLLHEKGWIVDARSKAKSDGFEDVP